jgi:hypothetical protein
MDLNIDRATNMRGFREPDMPFDQSADLFGMPKDPLNPDGDIFSAEVLALGLQEPLPAQNVVDEL